MKTASKKRGWKDSSKNNKNVKLGFTVLGFVIILIILGQFFSLIKTLVSPWGFDTSQQAGSSASKKYTWDKKYNINVVLQSDEIYLLNYNPTEQKATIVEIPGEAYLALPNGLGSWMLKSIFDLGESQEVGIGPQLIKSSVSNLAGVPIDGFILFEDSERELNEIIDDIRGNIIAGPQTLFDIKSDLTPLELWNLNMGLWKVRSDKIKYIDLSDSDVFTSDRLSDGTTAMIADSNKFDSLLGDFVDPKIREENLSVAVYNATEYPQLAQKASRMINNLGGNVIIISNDNKPLEKTLVIGEKSLTLERLNQIFNLCYKNESCDNITRAQNPSGRAQINIFLGEDFAKLFSNYDLP